MCVPMLSFSLSLSLVSVLVSVLTIPYPLTVIWLPLVFTAPLYMYNCFANPSFRMLLPFSWSIHVFSLYYSLSLSLSLSSAYSYAQFLHMTGLVLSSHVHSSIECSVHEKSSLSSLTTTWKERERERERICLQHLSAN